SFPWFSFRLQPSRSPSRTKFSTHGRSSPRGRTLSPPDGRRRRWSVSPTRRVISKVRYAKGADVPASGLASVAEPQQDGLVPVGLRHVVHITGLDPGATYSYQAVSTRVVKLKAYWPDKGLSTEAPVARFTTLDPRKPA